MRFAVLGAGALGCLCGGLLSLAGNDVTLVGRRRHMSAVRERGLILEPVGGGDPVVCHPRAIDDPDALEPVDAVIVLVKCFDTVEAARSIRHAVTPDTWVVTLQNGLGNDRLLSTVYSPDQVIPGTTTAGADVIEPGRMTLPTRVASGGSITQFAPPRTAEEFPEGVIAVAEALTAAGLPTEVRPDTEVILWVKFAMAVSMGPVTAALKKPISGVWGTEAGRALVRSLFDEAVAVALAEGVPVDAEAAWEHCADTWTTADATKYTSMSVDAIEGRRTEIDAFSFEIARRAAACGLAAPRNETLGWLVRIHEPQGPQG